MQGASKDQQDLRIMAAAVSPNTVTPASFLVVFGTSAGRLEVYSCDLSAKRDLKQQLVLQAELNCCLDESGSGAGSVLSIARVHDKDN